MKPVIDRAIKSSADAVAADAERRNALMSGTVDARFKSLSGSIDAAIRAGGSGSGLSSVSHDGTLSGDGTFVSPLTASPLSGTVDGHFNALSGTVNSAVVSLSGTINSAIVSLSGTINSAFANAVTVTSGTGATWYGAGVDGDLVFDGSSTISAFAGLSLAPASSVYTLTRDLFASNMTVNVGVDVVAAGFRIFVLNTLTLSGRIHRNGTVGNDGVGTSGGAAVAALADAVIGGGGNGGSGGGSGTGGNAPTVASPTHLGRATASVAHGGLIGGTLQGGSGGDGENGVRIGGSVPGYVYVPNSADSFQSVLQAISGRTIGTSPAALKGGTGGAGGGGGNAGGGGGGGGGGGATVIVAARIVAGTGSIEAKGGNGGNGSTTSGAAGGGGGGGGGGVVVVVTDSQTLLPITVSVAGGAKGVKGVGGGGTAQDGGAGGDGLIYLFSMRAGAK